MPIGPQCHSRDMGLCRIGVRGCYGIFVRKDCWGITAAVTKKMQAFAPKSSPTDGIKESLAASLAGINPQTKNAPDSAAMEKAAAEKSAKAKKDEAALLEIRDELQSLAKNLPTTTLQQEMEAVNRLYQSLVAAAYSKTATADEKFYFNDHLRPRLEQEFQRIFKWKTGIYP